MTLTVASNSNAILRQRHLPVMVAIVPVVAGFMLLDFTPDHSATWENLTPAVISISGSTATRVSNGEAKIKARWSGGVAKTFKFTVATDNSDRVVTVVTTGTDADRGNALATAYTTAKSLTPNGRPLSAENRATVLIPPGGYLRTTNITLDAEFVDLVATFPESGGDRLVTDVDRTLLEGSNSLDSYRPSGTVVYTETQLVNVLQQTASDVRMIGFTAAILCESWEYLQFGTGIHALRIGDIDNRPSYYAQMYFWSTSTENFHGSGVGCHRDFGGTWVKCIGNAWSFCLGKGNYPDEQSEPDAIDGKFRARMIDCQGGGCAFIGDGVESAPNLHCAVGAVLIRCRAIGLIDGLESSGYSAFGGCGFVGSRILNNCYFEDCESGEKSYGLARKVGGTLINCSGGELSFGGNGTFAGTAIGCIAEGGSFGGRNIPADVTPDAPWNEGTLIKTTITGQERPMNLRGAIIDRCRITTTTANRDALRLLESGSVIKDSTIRVVQGSTGIPINAGSAYTATVSGCTMNNAVNDPDGLGANVTNLASPSNNTVTNS